MINKNKSVQKSTQKLVTAMVKYLITLSNIVKERKLSLL